MSDSLVRPVNTQNDIVILWIWFVSFSDSSQWLGNVTDSLKFKSVSLQKMEVSVTLIFPVEFPQVEQI